TAQAGLHILSLHDALPISIPRPRACSTGPGGHRGRFNPAACGLAPSRKRPQAFPSTNLDTRWVMNRTMLLTVIASGLVAAAATRSEERRVGKEGRSRT